MVAGASIKNPRGGRAVISVREVALAGIDGDVDKAWEFDQKAFGDLNVFVMAFFADQGEKKTHSFYMGQVENTINITLRSKLNILSTANDNKHHNQHVQT